MNGVCMKRLCATIGVLWVLTGPTLARQSEVDQYPPPFDAGPLASRGVSILTNLECQAVGPVIEYRRDAAGRSFLSVHPFYSKSTDPVAEHEIQDFLWPVASTVSKGKRCSWRFLLLYGRDWDKDKPSRARWMLFPLVAYGTDSRDKPFFALMPFGGEVREMFWRDSIRFVLFPVYLSSRVDDQVSHSVLWPIVSWTKGEGR